MTTRVNEVSPPFLFTRFIFIMSITEALYEETENLVSGETNFEGILDRMMDRGTDYLNDKIEELFTGNPIGRAVYKTAYVSNANRILSGEIGRAHV